MHPRAWCGGELVRIRNLLAPRRVFEMCQSKRQSICARSFKSFGYLQPHSVSAQEDYEGTRVVPPGVHCTKHVRVYVSAQKGY